MANPSDSLHEQTVRPLTVADATVDQPVYALRVHAGERTLDPAIITDVKTRVVHRNHHRSDELPVGTKTEVTVRNEYGNELHLTLYGNAEAFEADYPDKDDDGYRQDRTRALQRQQDPRVYLADSDGPLALPLTPVWGAQVSVTALVPDIDPATLRQAMQDMLDEQFPGHRTHRIKARPVADVRVNVYREDRTSLSWAEGHPAAWTPVAFNVLDAEGFSYGGNGCTVQQVPRNAPSPVVGH